jgi:hypothetical protein
MKKSERITAFVETLGTAAPAGEPGDTSRAGLDPHYLGFFQCFNAGQYYEAHDVLEHLWLSGVGEEYAFFKGLIQIAGAFVHLRKQYLRPDHPKDGKRLRPAVRLFLLGTANIEPYGPIHLHLDVAALCENCRGWVESIESAGYTRNPWTPEKAPTLNLT